MSQLMIKQIEDFYGEKAKSTWNSKDIENKVNFIRNSSNLGSLEQNINSHKLQYRNISQSNYNPRVNAFNEKENSNRDMKIYRELITAESKDAPCFSTPANIMRKCISLGTNGKSTLRGFLRQENGLTHFGYPDDGDMVPVKFKPFPVRKAVIGGYTNTLSNQTEIFPYIYASFMASENLVIEEYDDKMEEDPFSENVEFTSFTEDDIKREYDIQAHLARERNVHLEVEDLIKIVYKNFSGMRSIDEIREAVYHKQNDVKMKDEFMVDDRYNIPLVDEEFTEDLEKIQQNVYFPPDTNQSPYSIVESLGKYVLLSEFVKDCSEREFYRLIYILFDGLEHANTIFGYVNYSLFANKIAIVDNGTEIKHKCGIESRYTPKILDSSRSRIVQGGFYLYYHHEKPIINSFYENYPISDVYTLFVSLYPIANTNIKKILDNLWQQNVIRPYSKSMEINKIMELIPSMGTNIENLPYMKTDFRKFKYGSINETLKSMSNKSNIPRNEKCNKWTTGRLINTLDPKIRYKDDLDSELSEKIHSYFKDSLERLTNISDNSLIYTTEQHNAEVLKGLKIDKQHILAGRNPREIKDSKELVALAVVNEEIKRMDNQEKDGMYYSEEDITNMDVISVEAIKDIVNITTHFVDFMDHKITLLNLRELTMIYLSSYSIIDYIIERFSYENYHRLNKYAMREYLESVKGLVLVKRHAYLKIYKKYIGNDLEVELGSKSEDKNTINEGFFSQKETDWEKIIKFDTDDIKMINISPLNLTVRENEEGYLRKDVVNPIKNAALFTFESATHKLAYTKFSLQQMRDSLVSWLDSKPYYYTATAAAKKVMDLF
jgi:hypothetical protein